MCSEKQRRVNMPYRSKVKEYVCKLSLELEQDKKILDALTTVLGEPEECGRLHPFVIEDKDKTYQGFQIRVEESLLASLVSRIEALGIDFSKIFERDYGHFHPYCYIDGEYHEGIAEGDESGWKLSYVDEDGLIGNEVVHFICYIRNEDIETLDEINCILQEWLIKNLSSVHVD
jgi:hypothetical protein